MGEGHPRGHQPHKAAEEGIRNVAAEEGSGSENSENSENSKDGKGRTGEEERNCGSGFEPI